MAQSYIWYIYTGSGIGCDSLTGPQALFSGMAWDKLLQLDIILLCTTKWMYCADVYAGSWGQTEFLYGHPVALSSASGNEAKRYPDSMGMTQSFTQDSLRELSCYACFLY